MLRRTLGSVVLVMALIMTMMVPTVVVADEHERHVLIFTATTQFRHVDAINQGTPAIEQALEAVGITSEHTEDSSIFNDEDLARFDALVMFQASGDPWSASEKAAMEAYQQNGGGIVAIHNASDMRGNYTWWDNLIGSLMPAHAATGNDPGLQATVQIEDFVHPSTQHFDGDTEWVRSDEWYNFSTNVRGDAHVLLTMDETTYNPGGQAMGYDHPISWCKLYDGGRAWVTAMGHFGSHYSEPDFLDHIVGGVQYAAGQLHGDCGGTVWDSFEKVELDGSTTNPFGLTVAPDGRVFYTEIALGQIRVYDPETEETSVAIDLDAYGSSSPISEDGVLGIALDPDFEDNSHLFVYWSPDSDDNTDPDNFWNRVSRFTVEEDSTISMDSEVLIIEVEARRLPDEPGHTGGGLGFDLDGNLLLSVGDDVNPHSEPSGGYAPISTRPGTFHDARVTSANTNDLRGSLLRITPEPDGGYSIPPGNMFDPDVVDHDLFPDGEYDPDLVREEIYAMGFRNPFRFAVDPVTGAIGLADYGPDAGSNNPNNRGPAGKVSWSFITEPGFHGWPMCQPDKEPYRYVDYEQQPPAVGDFFDCDNPINDAPGNTGLEQLPSVTEADIVYGYQMSTVPDVIPSGGGLSPMGGPFYDYDPDLESDTKWPEYYHGKPLFYEWSKNQVWSLVLDKDGGEGDHLLKINPFMTGTSWAAPMDMEFGPDGALYVLEWGSGFDMGSPNPTSGLYRIDYTEAAADAEEPDPVDPVLPPCFGLRSDDFSGDELDEEKWPEIRGAGDDLPRIEDGALTMPIVQGDINEGEPGPIAFLGQPMPDPSEEWQVTIHFEIDHFREWQHIGLMQHVDDDNYIKLAFTHNNSGGRFFEFQTEINGSRTWHGNNIDVPGSFPDEAWLRLASNGSQLLASYSQDGESFLPLGGTATALQGGSLGIVGAGDTGSDTIDATVHSFVFQPDEDDTDAGPDDHFDGDSLNGCIWDRTVRYDPDYLTVADGWLTLETTPEDFLGAANDAPNLVLQEAPDGDWTIETFMSAGLERNWQNAGLLYHQDDDNYLKMGVVALNQPGSARNLAFEVATEINGNFSVIDNIPVPDSSNDDYYLRLIKEGNSFTAQRSLDGEDWVTFSSASVNFSDAAFGLYAVGTDNQTSSIEVSFDYFLVDADDDPTEPGVVEASLDPADPDGDNDWYVSPVSLLLASDDEDAELAWRLAGDDEWIEWTEPVVFDDDGSYAIEYLGAEDGDGGEPGEGDVHDVDVGPGFAFDPTALTVSQGDSVVFTLQGGFHNVVVEDLDGNEIDRSGEPSSDWEDEPFEFTADTVGTFIYHCEPHPGMEGTLTVLSSSEPGIGLVTFNLDQTPPETEASLDGEQDDGAYIDEVTLTLSATDATSGVAETHWREQGGDDQVYDLDVPLVFDEPGSYTIEYRSQDVAGNVEDWQTVSFEIVEEQPPAELELELVASTRCVAGNVFLVVTARNDNEVPVDVEFESEFGSRAFAGVAPDRFASHAFNTRLGGVDAGSVTVRGSAVVDGVEVSVEETVDFDAMSCD